MPAPRRARTRLACGLAATAVAAVLALAPLASVEGPLRQALAWLAAAGLLLAAGAALRLVRQGDRVHAAAPLVGAGLLLYAELASWAREARPQVRDEHPVLAARATVVAASTLAALALGVLVLLAAAVPAGGGLARLAVGVAAATATLALVAVVARPTSTRARRG
jgi:hypothetical protein